METDETIDETEDTGGEQVGFGQASLGEAQSDNPPLDPEMLDAEDEGDEEIDPDPPLGPIDGDERDPAEG